MSITILYYRYISPISFKKGSSKNIYLQYIQVVLLCMRVCVFVQWTPLLTPLVWPLASNLPLVALAQFEVFTFLVGGSLVMLEKSNCKKRNISQISSHNNLHYFNGLYITMGRKVLFLCTIVRILHSAYYNLQRLTDRTYKICLVKL